MNEPIKAITAEEIRKLIETLETTASRYDFGTSAGALMGAISSAVFGPFMFIGAVVGGLLARRFHNSQALESKRKIELLITELSNKKELDDKEARLLLERLNTIVFEKRDTLLKESEKTPMH